MSLAYYNGCGDRIRTYDLRVMSPTSYLAALLRAVKLLVYNTILKKICQQF